MSPQPIKVKVARLLGGEITVRGYPLSMVYAEKLVTAVQRKLANTRWRDFADVYLLSARHSIRADELAQSIKDVATYRKTTMTPLTTALAGFETAAQAKWAIWLQNERLGDRLPTAFADVLAAVQSFADPLIAGEAAGLSWEPTTKQWN